jgi:hypothetical protein
MDLRVYEAVFRSIQGMDQTLESLNIVEKRELGFAESISRVRTNLSDLRSYANNHFAFKIAQKEQEEEKNFYRARRDRENAGERPNEIHLELKSRGGLRRQQGFPPRPVILPRTQGDDDRILAMQKAAPSLSIQPEQPRVTGDSEQESQKGGTPT